MSTPFSSGRKQGDESRGIDDDGFSSPGQLSEVQRRRSILKKDGKYGGGSTSTTPNRALGTPDSAIHSPPKVMVTQEDESQRDSQRDSEEEDGPIVIRSLAQVREDVFATLLSRSALLTAVRDSADFASAVMQRLKFETFNKGSLLCRRGVRVDCSLLFTFKAVF